MHSLNPTNDIITAVALAAEVCIKPWKYSVVRVFNENDESLQEYKFNDLILLLECRDSDGKRMPSNDIELEIYLSGLDINVMLCWVESKDDFILWQGSHSIWLDAKTGKRIENPMKNNDLELLSRRVRAIFQPSD